VEETASAVEKERAALTDGERVARDLQARLDAISRVSDSLTLDTVATHSLFISIWGCFKSILPAPLFSLSNLCLFALHTIGRICTSPDILIHFPGLAETVATYNSVLHHASLELPSSALSLESLTPALTSCTSLPDIQILIARGQQARRHAACEANS
jgi:hypothetical protein